MECSCFKIQFLSVLLKKCVFSNCGHTIFTSNLLEQHFICVYFNFGNRWGFCYAKNGAGSSTVGSRAGCQLHCSVLGLLLSKLSFQAVPGSLSDSVDWTLNTEIQGELHSPGTACPFQLSNDSCLVGKITNRRYLKKHFLTKKTNKLTDNESDKTESSLFGSSKESQSELVKALNTQVRYKGWDAVNLEPNFNNSCSCVCASFCHPENGR